MGSMFWQARSLAFALTFLGVLATHATVASGPLIRLPPVEQHVGVVSGRSTIGHSWQKIAHDEEGRATSPIALTRFTQLGDILDGGDVEARFRIGGYGKLDFIHDFDAVGDTDKFDVATIPTDGRPGEPAALRGLVLPSLIQWESVTHRPIPFWMLADG